MQLFNTLTGEKERIEPAGEIGLYVCGVTPYDITHIGHARTYLVFDVLVRHLMRRGNAVNYVQNITDVDDSIIKRAQELDVSYLDLGDRYASIYFEDIAALGILPANRYPRATGAIPAVQKIIATLLERGHAYQVGGDVYFRISSWDSFGKLSRLRPPQMLQAESEQDAPTIDDPRKENALDFPLWRAARPGEPWWESPWGRGRPGWHIECSALALAHLGPQIDIHGGGDDLVYPHHECELAQSEAATGVRPFARVWMHVAMARLGGSKMSKSEGNMVFVRDVLGRYTPDAVRLHLLSTHYRSPLDFGEADLPRWTELAGRLTAAATAPVRAAAGEDIESEGARAEFLASLNDDLDIPAAIDVASGLADYILERGDSARAGYGSRRTLRTLLSILGLQLTGDHR